MKSEFEMLRVSDMVHKKVYALRFLQVKFMDVGLKNVL